MQTFIFSVLLFSCEDTEEQTQIDTAPVVERKEELSFKSFQVASIILEPEAESEGIIRTGIYPSLEEFAQNSYWAIYEERKKSKSSDSYSLLLSKKFYPNAFTNEENPLFEVKRNLEEGIFVPRAFDQTSKQPKYEKGGVFSSNQTMRVFSFSQIVANQETLQTKFLETIREDKEFPSMMGTEFQRNGERKDKAIASLSSPGMLYVVCWGGWESGEWPTPKKEGSITGSSQTWGGKITKSTVRRQAKYQISDEEKFKKQEKQPAKPRTDLKYNACELLYADQLNVMVNKEKFLKTRFYSLGFLSGSSDPMRRGKKKHISGPDFRTQSSQTIVFDFDVLRDFVLDKGGHESTSEEDDADTEENETAATSTDTKEQKEETKQQEETKQEKVTAEQDPAKAVPVQTADTGAVCPERNLNEDFHDVLTRAETWIQETDTKLKWNEQHFEIGTIEENNGDCYKIKVILKGVRSTAGCRPKVKKTKKCETTIADFVKFVD